MQERSTGPQPPRRDEAIGELANGLAPPPAGTVERRGGLEVGETLHREQIEAVEQAAQLDDSALGRCASQYFHHYDIGDDEVLLIGDQPAQAHVRSTAGRPEILDPGGGVGQDHGSATSSGRRSSLRSPSQPVPSMASASSSVMGSPTSRRSARSTAARLVGRRYRRIARSTSRSSISMFVLL